MQGQYSLFNLFENQGGGAADNRTRNYLQPERNTLLVHRYYFYGWIKDYKYSRCLQELEREFFLAERTIINLLSVVDSELQNLHRTKPTVKELQAKFPWMNWNV